MNLAPTDEQQALRDAVRGAVQRDASFAAIRAWVLEGDVDTAPAWELAANQGWTGIGVAEEAGGQGGGVLEASILAEELGRGGVPADALYASILAARVLTHAGAEAAELVEQIADGAVGAALLRTGAAPLDTPPATSAALVLAGAEADVFVVVDGGRIGTLGAAQVERVGRRLVDRTRSLADVTAGAEPAWLAGDGDAALADATAWSAVLIAADALGACQRMLDLTVEYVGQRVQFGTPVGSFQAVKHAASEMLVAIEGLRAVVQYGAWAVGEAVPAAEVDAWVAKARAARTAPLVADKALFLHGAVGYTWEHDLQLLFKRAKSDAQLFGGAGAYDDRIADALALTGD